MRTCLMMNHLLFYGLALTVINVVASETDLVCVRIDDCPVLKKLVDKVEGIEQAIQLLVQSECGFEDNERLVWCPLAVDSCTTPEGLPGICTEISKCPKFFEKTFFFDSPDKINLQTYFEKLKCNQKDSKIHICCVAEDQSTEFSNVRVNIPTTEKTTDKKDLLPNPDLQECGQQLSDGRITGGEIAGIDEFPWMALLQYKSNKGLSIRCGGTLINDRYVLTAAHCVDQEPQELYSVIFGEYDLRNETDCIYIEGVPDCADPPVSVKVESISLHPGWLAVERRFYNDIALVRLQTPVKFTSFIRPICLPPGTYSYNTSTKLTVAGWGRTETDDRSPIKKKLLLKSYDVKNCSSIYRRELNPGQLCLGNNKGDTCNGDSGNAAMEIISGNGTVSWILVGIVSLGWNNPCGIYPGVYTYTTPYLRWIKQTIQP